MDTPPTLLSATHCSVSLIDRLMLSQRGHRRQEEGLIEAFKEFDLRVESKVPWLSSKMKALFSRRGRSTNVGISPDEHVPEIKISISDLKSEVDTKAVCHSLEMDGIRSREALQLATLAVVNGSYILPKSMCQKYRIVEEIGVGASGFVCRGVCLTNSTEVAIKFIIKEKLEPGRLLEDSKYGMVPLEIYMLKRLKHTNIIKLYDVYQDGVYFYMICELHGSLWQEEHRLFGHEELSKSTGETSLKELARSRSKLHPSGSHQEIRANSACPRRASSPCESHRVQMYSEEARRPRRASFDLFDCIDAHAGIEETIVRGIFEQILSAECYLLKHNILHRDLKDENIVVDRNYQIKIVDFGSSSYFKDGNDRLDDYMGTLEYAPPEVFRGEPYSGIAAEVWSMGVLLYTMLSGKSFVRSQIVVSPPNVSCDVANLLSRLLEEDPHRRATLGEIRCHPWLRGM